MPGSGNNEYKHADSGRTSICYHERGSGEPLVLIMGFGADGTVWEKHAAVYEKHFRCIVLDNRGVGRSGQPAGPYSTKMMADDTIAVMDHAGVDKARVVGISMGGAIAQELAINYPDRVQSLVLVSTWARFNAYAKAVYENLKHIRASVLPQYFTELLQLWIYAPPYYEKHADILRADAEAAAQGENPQSRAGFEGQLDACINHDAVERLHNINVPVMITVGSMDIFTPPAFSELIHQRIKHSVFSIYPEGGHVHHWEDLGRFNRETLAFLLNH
jgi:pimeloyl-ACP methyl ester carboxylesterase